MSGNSNRPMNWDREHSLSRGRAPHVAVFRARVARLRCGHEAVGFPAVTMPVSLRPDLYECPQGCGLVRARS